MGASAMQCAVQSLSRISASTAAGSPMHRDASNDANVCATHRCSQSSAQRKADQWSAAHAEQGPIPLYGQSVGVRWSAYSCAVLGPTSSDIATRPTYRNTLTCLHNALLKSACHFAHDQNTPQRPFPPIPGRERCSRNARAMPLFQVPERAFC